MGLPIGLFVAMIIILLNIWLTIRLNSYLAVFKSEHFQYRFLFGALAASLFGFGIPVIAKLPGRFSNTAKQKNMDSVNIPIQQVILEQTGIRCPICDAFPEESGHYIIRCYHCNAEFCSKHISQYDDRCWRCRTPIPYIKELKYAIKENLSSK
ncbi:hypothetical protein JW979_16070 [bacterium]|nr:hypothetical protein [candidate division CSSED10-310 bacterium]